VLSGGERGRYALLRLLLHPANFLLLDEPTNHLDLRAKDVLLNALMEYTGTVVFVSHDRYFIDKLATRVFEIGGGKVEAYPGNYEDYLWRKQGGRRVAPTLEDVPGMELVGEATGSSHVSRKRRDPSTSLRAGMGHPKFFPGPTGGAPLLAEVARSGNDHRNPGGEAQKKRLNPIKRRQMEERIRELEAEISRTETAIAQCETGLQEFISAEETLRQSQELERQKTAHAALIEEWEELGEALQEAE